MTIELLLFNEPTKRLQEEHKSKLLKEGTNLYNHLMNLKKMLTENNFYHTDRIGLHSQVLNDTYPREPVETFIERVKQLEGRPIEVSDKKNYSIIGGAVVLLIGQLPSYKKIPHVTIAYFKDPQMTQKALEFILSKL